jgi:PAS domain S-box-containing protein
MSDTPARLLIVDDNPDDHEFYRRALAGEHEQAFQLLAAYTGAEGLANCRAERPDCVVLDFQLPDMDALEFLAALKGGRTESPVAVVVVTGQGNEVLAVKAMKAGAHDYLVKRAGYDEVRRAVRSAMARQTRAAEQTYRVLIIDDSPEDRLTYRRRLERGPEHYQFAEAETAGDGIALARSFLPDCVLLDYNLPDADGLEVLTTLLAEDRQHELAVLMLTGQGNETIAVRALKAGAEDYLVKGPSLENLPQAVRSALEKVSLRRRLEEQRQELERNRNQLRVTLASIGDAVIVTDVDANVTYLNPVAEALTGWSLAEASGRPLHEVFVIVNEQSRATVSNPAMRALQEGVVVGLANHTVLIARDGRETPIDDSAAPIRSETGEVFGAVLVFRDVAERRRTERSLLLQARVLDSMVEGVSVADAAGMIFYTNPAEERMFGYDRGEMLGQHVTIQNDYPAEENDRRVNAVIEQLRSGGTWLGEWRNRRKDGSGFTSFARITTLDVEGEQCFVCVQEDITDRKRLEDELQRRVTELALADKRKDQFLAMLAHELRNPLAPIKNSLHVLKLRSGDWQTVDQVREIMERQVGHMSRLVDDLLDVSRITQAKVTLRLERIDLVRLADQCLNDHRSAFAEAEIGLSLSRHPTPVWVQGDATRLTQVIDNFLTNALKFTNPGGEVRVAVDMVDHHARLTVQDSGIGMDPDILPFVFDVFAQADRSLDRSRGGMGLGLAVVKGLVELHGGTVTASSAGLGQGATMTVLLPLEHELPALSSHRAERTGRASLRKVLIVEDNFDSASSLRMLLTAFGFDVRVAGTGQEGLAVASEWRPEAVICDIGLPGLDGFAVARALRNDISTSAVRLIALTGYGREEDLAQARAAGFDELFVKPADPDKLLAALSR